MKVALGYAAVALVVIFMATELVTVLRPAVEVPFSIVNKALSGAQ
jgi:hypothetical protein